jgi:hypothetical protein
MSSWSPSASLATGFRTLRLRLLVARQFLRSLLYLLEQPPVIARLDDCGLQLLAQLRQALESLLVGEVLMQYGFHGHPVPEGG